MFYKFSANYPISKRAGHIILPSFFSYVLFSYHYPIIIYVCFPMFPMIFPSFLIIIIIITSSYQHIMIIIISIISITLKCAIPYEQYVDWGNNHHPSFGCLRHPHRRSSPCWTPGRKKNLQLPKRFNFLLTPVVDGFGMFIVISNSVLILYIIYIYIYYI